MNVLTGSKHCGNQNGIAITLFSRQFEVNWVVKKSALVRSKILRLFVNTWTADDKYSRSNMQNLPQQFQTPLSHKEKTYCGFLLHFWNVHEI